MKHEPVTGSSNIASIGYDPVTKTCYVRFHGGGHYAYENVPQEKFDTFLAAAKADGTSTGKHFHAHIKGQHAFKKL